MSSLISLLNDYTFQIVALGSCALGMICGLSGSFAVLRKQSLLGDSISHSALAGVAISFILTGSKRTEVILIGAAVVGLLATYLITQISRFSKAQFESVMAVVMSSFFGLGLMLLTYIQRIPDANQAGLNRFLFGQAATLLKSDVLLIVIVSAVILMVTILCFKEFKVFTFDRDYAKDLGLPTGLLNFLLSTMIVLTVILGIQSVGVVLMSALLISPAVAARQWTSKLSSMIILASILGGISGLTGTVISSAVTDFPTGPAIVLIISILLIFSILVAPQRGILWRQVNHQKARTKGAAEMVLTHLMDQGVTSFNASQFKAMSISQTHYTADKLISILVKSGMVIPQDDQYIIQEKAYIRFKPVLKGEVSHAS